MERHWQKLSTLIVILSGVFPLIFQLLQRGNVESIVLLGTIYVIIIVYFIYQYTKDKIDKIDDLVNRIEELEKEVNTMERFHKLDKRVAVLENKKDENHKGSTDPQLVILIILLVLLALYIISVVGVDKLASLI